MVGISSLRFCGAVRLKTAANMPQSTRNKRCINRCKVFICGETTSDSVYQPTGPFVCQEKTLHRVSFTCEN